VLQADVADAAQVDAAAAAAERELGPIDVWVNCAMVSVFSPVRELEPEETRRVTEVTYLGYVHGTLAALSRMLPRDRGTIVQVGSALAYRSIPLQALYCGAKAAIRGFTDSLRTELLHDGSGVRVTQVDLPALNTPQFDLVRSRLPNRPQPVPPIYDPEVAARAIVWAAEHAPAASTSRCAAKRSGRVVDLARDREQQGGARHRRPLPRADGVRLAADGRARAFGPTRQPLGARAR
jgi:NAD(P)-dependent dehydrogenase (short-subunit alcohol dehydrogenase family)